MFWTLLSKILLGVLEELLIGLLVKLTLSVITALFRSNRNVPKMSIA